MSDSTLMHRYVRTWEVMASRGCETSWIDLGPTALRARGRAVGLTPEPYWVTYALQTGEDFVTRRLEVTVQTGTGTTSLDLRRDEAGQWTADGTPRPDLDDALDCDLGLCPLTNTMPVLRHGLHRRAEAAPREFLMAWVSVPDLSVRPLRQRYTHLASAEHGARIRYESGSFRSDLEVDEHGLVLDYPQLASALTR
ncbi:putative glycolipid-binding domain-containing protein [Streptomyces sp. NPDC089919]|uniref:putative glycolipid-binding domain-containing protein n=1 Tax=Streptomyces sp. NPDC089919 TaxID=3155188 RepID=UPI0034466923